MNAFVPHTETGPKAFYVIPIKYLLYDLYTIFFDILIGSLFSLKSNFRYIDYLVLADYLR